MPQIELITERSSTGAVVKCVATASTHSSTLVKRHDSRNPYMAVVFEGSRAPILDLRFSGLCRSGKLTARQQRHSPFDDLTDVEA